MSENQNIGIYRPSDNKANDKPVVNRRAEANEKAIQKVEARSDYNSTVAADPQNIGPTVKNELGKTNKILLGRIQYVLPFINSYRVALEDGEGVIPCCRTSSDSGFLNGGVHDYSVLPPTTPVVVLKHHSILFGFIIAAYPEMNDDGDSTFAEWLVQGSGVGIFREGYYSSLINLLTDEGGTYDFSKGMPIDSTAIDWGRITSFG